MNKKASCRFIRKWGCRRDNANLMDVFTREMGEILANLGK